MFRRVASAFRSRYSLLMDEIKKLSRKLDTIINLDKEDDDDEDESYSLKNVFELLQDINHRLEKIEEKSADVEKISAQLQQSHSFVQTMLQRTIEGSIERAIVPHVNGHDGSDVSESERLRRRLQARRDREKPSAGYAAVDRKAR